MLQPARRKYRKEHKGRNRGLALRGANVSFGEFGLKGLLNYTNGKNRDTGDGLYNIMPLNAKVALTHQLGGWDNAIEWVGAMAKDDVSDVRNEIETPGYGIANLRASYSWKQARVDVGVENLPSAEGSAGSTCLRKRASDLRLSEASTSGAHHSSPVPPGPPALARRRSLAHDLGPPADRTRGRWR